MTTVSDSNYGFDCPEGTRIIIQRPDGYFTALIEGTVRMKLEIKDNCDPVFPQQRVIGGSMTLDAKVTPQGDGPNMTLWRVALGEYEAAV